MYPHQTAVQYPQGPAAYGNMNPYPQYNNYPVPNGAYPVQTPMGVAQPNQLWQTQPPPYVSNDKSVIQYNAQGRTTNPQNSVSEPQTVVMPVLPQSTKIN